MAGNPAKIWARHAINDGWRPDLAPSAEAAVSTDGRIVVPYLTDAKNVEFGPPSPVQELRKLPGLARLNSAQMESGAALMGLFDYWRFGGSLTGTQRRVAHCGTKILADAADGSFSAITTGLSAGAVPCYTVMNDELVIASDGDTPLVYDGSTCAGLGGSPPAFSFCVQHKNRMWAAGVAAAGSTLYYSVADNHEDWSGGGSGSILIDSADGDRITGLVSHKDRLFVFKGPNRGSIHMITGSSPTGSDSFAKQPFVYGLGAACHAAIFAFGNDVGFVTPYGAVHTLSATDAYGSFALASLSNGLNDWIGVNFAFARMKYVGACADLLNSKVYITVSINASTTHNRVLILDYRFNPPRWTYDERAGAASVGLVRDTANNGRPVVMFGGYDGYIRRPTSNSAIDGATAFGFKATTPFLHYGFPQMLKTIEGGAVAIVPLNDGDFALRWFRDTAAYQSVTIEQGGGAVLDAFVLDTDVLGGARNSDRFWRAEESGSGGGTARAIAWEVYQAALNEDFRMTGWMAELTAAGESYESV